LCHDSIVSAGADNSQPIRRGRFCFSMLIQHEPNFQLFTICDMARGAALEDGKDRIAVSVCLWIRRFKNKRGLMKIAVLKQREEHSSGDHRACYQKDSRFRQCHAVISLVRSVPNCFGLTGESTARCGEQPMTTVTVEASIAMRASGKLKTHCAHLMSTLSPTTDEGYGLRPLPVPRSLFLVPLPLATCEALPCSPPVSPWRLRCAE
jgi:hypothetical protein